MENNHFIDEDQIKVQKHRPTFLTVLCIITFVVSGLMLLSTIWSFITYDPENQEYMIEESLIAMEQMVNESGGVFGDDFIENYKTTLYEQIEYATPLNLISLFSVLLSLMGAILMYRMKRIGFHIYVASKLVGMAPLFMLTLNQILGIGYGVMGVLTLVFVILYAVNLKHLKA